MTRHLLSTSLLVGLLAGSALAQTPPPPGHLRVQLEATVESDDDAVFRWTLDPAEEATCTLDADGDGIFEHSVEDCDANRSLRHSYDEEGTYHAILVARTHDGRSGQATVTVTID
ncbi:MAG: PKD domain-containing protein [Sandaracinaceae bacterium]